jgi:BMFP domain-containing protein YqiC
VAVRSRLELAAFEARVRVLELHQTDYDGYRAIAQVHLRDLMAAW